MATMKKRGPKPKKPGERKILIPVWVKEKHKKEARSQADKLEAIYG